MDLEKTMSLFVLDSQQSSELLDPYHRIHVANEVNSAILASQGQDQGSKLPSLLKLLLWSEDQLSAKANFPKLENVVEASFAEPSSPMQQ